MSHDKNLQKETEATFGHRPTAKSTFAFITIQIGSLKAISPFFRLLGREAPFHTHGLPRISRFLCHQIHSPHRHSGHGRQRYWLTLEI